MKIAFIGLGAMGSRMAKRLIDAGNDLFIYNRTKEKALPLIEAGADFFETPRQAAEKAEIVISMVTDNQASKEIWLNDETGAIHGLQTGATVIESSTLTPDWIQKLAGEIEKKGVNFIEAPVVGSRPQAEAGQLVYLIGGDEREFENVREILSQVGGKIFQTGEIGSATMMKLAVNALFGIQTAALAEMLAFLNKSGIETTKSLEILNELPIMSPAAKRIGGLIAEQNFSPNFPIELVAKDFSYVVETAENLQANSPISQATRDLFNSAKPEYGNLDIAGIFRIFEK